MPIGCCSFKSVESGAVPTRLATVLIALVSRTAIAGLSPWQSDVAVRPSDVEIALDLCLKLPPLLSPIPAPSRGGLVWVAALMIATVLIVRPSRIG